MNNNHDIIESTLLWEHLNRKDSKIKTNLSIDTLASLMLRQYLEIPYLNRIKSY